MVNAKAAPALPWGASAEENHDDRSNVNSESQRSLDASTTAPDHSDRPQAQVTMPSADSIIEVRWQLEEDHKTETVWWKATLVGIHSAQAAAPCEAPAVLRYQAFRDFAEETAEVVFTADGYLYHSDNQDTLLRWRFEGDQQSESEDEDEGDVVLDANDLNQDEELLERELGVNAEDVMRQQLQSYPLDQQRQLASGARDFVDHFRQHLSQLAQASGGSHTVTANDVQGIFASLKKH